MQDPGYDAMSDAQSSWAKAAAAAKTEGWVYTARSPARGFRMVRQPPHGKHYAQFCSDSKVWTKSRRLLRTTSRRRPTLTLWIFLAITSS